MLLSIGEFIFSSDYYKHFTYLFFGNLIDWIFLVTMKTIIFLFFFKLIPRVLFSVFFNKELLLKVIEKRLFFDMFWLLKLNAVNLLFWNFIRLSSFNFSQELAFIKFSALYQLFLVFIRKGLYWGFFQSRSNLKHLFLFRLKYFKKFFFFNKT